MEAKVRLRCDCQKLLVTLGPMAEEQIREANCKRFEDTSKFELISKEIKKILESK